MAMDRIQLLLVGLPLFLFTSDIFNLFLSSPPPPKQPHSHHHHHHHTPQPHQPPSFQPQQQQQQQQPLDFPSQANGFGGVGVGHTVNIDFCSSCSFRGTAVTMKNMLEAQYPGIHVVLANYPPAPPKRALSKLVPVAQFGVIAVMTAGDHIFPRLGITPPPWYYTLKANKFGTISATWLFGNFLQNYLQNSGAFEVSLDGVPIYSKLKEQRFPGEIELKDLVGKRLASSTIVGGLGANKWS